MQGVLLLAGATIGLLLTLAVNSFHLIPEDVDMGAALTALAQAVAGPLGLIPEGYNGGQLPGFPAWLPFALYVSSANFGAGLLSGRGGLPFAAGGILAWWIVSPMAVSAGWVPAPPAMPLTEMAAWQAGEVYSQMLRPLGIGMLIGGALAGVVAAAPAVVGAMRSLQAAAQIARERGGSADEVSPNIVYGGGAGAFVLLFLAASFASAELSRSKPC